MRAPFTAAALALCVLAGASVSAGAASGIDWSKLHRPLHLPVVAPGSPCPVSKVDRRVNWGRTHIFGGSGIGPGPVYPGLGERSGLLYGTREVMFGGPWFGEKVFWYVAPSYRGPVLLRGRQLDGSRRLGFNGKRIPLPELRIAPSDSVRWQGQPPGSRGVPSDVRLLAAGCYGFQIDGTIFSRVVVVTADVAS
jgi:hypothetical protein